MGLDLIRLDCENLTMMLLVNIIFSASVTLVSSAEMFFLRDGELPFCFLALHALITHTQEDQVHLLRK